MRQLLENTLSVSNLIYLTESMRVNDYLIFGNEGAQLKRYLTMLYINRELLSKQGFIIEECISTQEKIELTQFLKSANIKNEYLEKIIRLIS